MDEPRQTLAVRVLRPFVEPRRRDQASPLARRIAEDKGLDLSTIAGSGPNGRIVKADVEDARPGAAPAKEATAPTPAPVKPATQGGDLDAACRAGLNEAGTGMLIPVSRGISRAEDKAKAAQELKEGINAARQAVIAAKSASADGSDDEVSVAPYQKEFLEFSLAEGVLKFGSFVLKSGRTSPYFFNAGLFASGGAMYKLGKAYASAIMSAKEL